MMNRYTVEYYTAGRWWRVGRTWRRGAANRAARRVERNIVCCATRVKPVESTPRTRKKTLK